MHTKNLGQDNFTQTHTCVYSFGPKRNTFIIFEEFIEKCIRRIPSHQQYTYGRQTNQLEYLHRQGANMHLWD
jgi:hypothetical protein